MRIVQKVTWIFGRNLLGFLAVAVLIIAVGFLPLALKITPGRFTQDVFSMNWPLYIEMAGSYIDGLLKGDLGMLKFQRRMMDMSDLDILTIVFEYTMRSVQIAIPAILIGAVTGMLAGGGSFFLPKKVRGWLGSLNQLLFSLPDILMVILLQMLAIKLNKWAGVYWLAIADFGNTRAVALPILCIAFPIAAYIYKYTVAACEEALSQEYVRTVRAKGLPERIIFVKHVMRPALDTILTVLPKMVAFGLSGMIIVERLFNIRGVTWFFGGRLSPDLAMLLATMLILLAAFVVAVNILTGVVRLWVNPALRK